MIVFWGPIGTIQEVPLGWGPLSCWEGGPGLSRVRPVPPALCWCCPAVLWSSAPLSLLDWPVFSTPLWACSRHTANKLFPSRDNFNNSKCCSGEMAYFVFNVMFDAIL